MDAYRHVPSGDFCEYYDMLVGPDGFECLLTEPEDRNWYRDGRAVVDRLNAQHAELTALRAEVERLREAVLAAYRKGHHHTVHGGYQWCDQGGREVVEEIIREAMEEG